MSKLELAIAWRYLKSRRGSRLLSFITVIAVGGVAVGVATLIVITGVMNGLQHDMREKILVGSPDIRITRMGSDMRMRDWREMLSRVKEDEGVVAAAPFVTTPALLGRGMDLDNSRDALVVGMEANATDTVTFIRDHIRFGSFDLGPKDEGRTGVVIGDMLAMSLGVQVGDTIGFISRGSFQENRALGEVSFHRFAGLVTGIFQTGMYDYDSRFAYVDLKDAMRMARLGDDVTGIEVRTRERWEAPEIARRLELALDRNFNYVEDWQAQNQALFSALKLEKLAMTIIVFLIVLVASFNIVSVLTMLVKDKTREIGILRAMGLRAISIRRVFLAQGIFIGLLGTSIGLIVGLATSISVGHYKLIPLDPSTYFIDYLPVRTEPLDVVLIALGSMLIALLATLNPSAQAARLYPLEAIRHE